MTALPLESDLHADTNVATANAQSSRRNQLQQLSRHLDRFSRRYRC
jgi:hypothetical protein